MEPSATTYDSHVRHALADDNRLGVGGAQVAAFQVGQIRAYLRTIVGGQHTLHGQAEAALEACLAAGVAPQAAGRAACEVVAQRAETLARLNGIAIRSTAIEGARAACAAQEADLLKVARGLHELGRSLSP